MERPGLGGRRRVALCAVTVLTLACASPQAHATYDEETFLAKTVPVYSIPTPPRGGTPTESVIGQIRAYRIRKGDTLIDLARYFALGYNEIVEANPGIDPWLPPVGATIILPTQWVLPCCSYEGLVVNIPEMRLFFYRRAPGDPGTTLVHTHAVGLGRDEWRTPSGKFRIRGKTVDPQWNIPESIRREHIAERGDFRTFIRGGDPENPLGRHRLELTLPMYGIHGTNIPWGVGMQVSHGCVRLYPEEIERLFPMVPVGAPGEFSYQTVKVGARGGTVYAEVHRDIYGYTPSVFREAMATAQRVGLADRIDEDLLIRTLEEGGGGMPVRVSREWPESSPPLRTASASPNPEQATEDITGDRAPHTDDGQARDD